jgi:GNAT superfamily N-acetyltransferase
MEDFADVILASYKLKRKDLLPISDTGYRIVYGHSITSPIRLEIAFSPNKMIIRRLFIRSSYQQQGLGRSIVEYLKQECRRQNLDEIELDTILQESAGFWGRCGFSINGCYGRWEAHET